MVRYRSAFVLIFMTYTNFEESVQSSRQKKTGIAVLRRVFLTQKSRSIFQKLLPIMNVNIYCHNKVNWYKLIFQNFKHYRNAIP